MGADLPKSALETDHVLKADINPIMSRKLISFFFNGTATTVIYT
jgi:hypothetical protein